MKIEASRFLLPIRIIACRRFNEMWETMSVNWIECGKKHMLHYLPNFIVAFNSLSVIVNTIANFSAGSHYDKTSNTTRRPYVLIMHLPFDSSKEYVYPIVILFQFSYLLIMSAGAATLNSVLLILVSGRDWEKRYLRNSKYLFGVYNTYIVKEVL